MDSLHSSAREDTELVVIETASFKLVIKGKPYHERFQALQQYRAMDYNETMQFTVAGETVEKILVFDVDEQRLTKLGQHRPIFFENGMYQLIISAKADTEFTFYHEHPTLRKAISRLDTYNGYLLIGNLQFMNEVGLSTFEIRTGSQTVLSVTMEIFPTKLDYKKDYRRLLEEVNDEIYNLAYHFIKKTYTGARQTLEGNPSKSEFYRLLQAHFHSLKQAITVIEKQPHHQLIHTYEKARGDQLRRLDQTGRRYLQKRAHLFQEVPHGIPVEQNMLMPVSGLVRKKDVTYDTLENRYMKWMMQRLIHKMTDLIGTLSSQTNRTSHSYSDIIIQLEAMKKHMETKLTLPFWRSIGKLDRSVMSLVLQMAPGYRDAFQIFLTLSRGLTLQGSMYQMSLKDIATLYEHLTFLKLGRLLENKYTLISQDIVKVNRDGLFLTLAQNVSAKRVYKHPVTDETITLTYQKSERNVPTVAQVPDMMLSIEKKGKDFTFNYVFDAKYRIDFAAGGSTYDNKYATPGPLEEDINTMHRYRDSLVTKRSGLYERTAYGAYVLFPWYNEEEYTGHKLYQSIDKVNVGGLPFLPNATTLVEQFIEHLIDANPEQLQQDGILPIGVREDWKSSFEEPVLVGKVPDRESLEMYLKHGWFEICKPVFK